MNANNVKRRNGINNAIHWLKVIGYARLGLQHSAQLCRATMSDPPKVRRYVESIALTILLRRLALLVLLYGTGVVELQMVGWRRCRAVRR